MPFAATLLTLLGFGSFGLRNPHQGLIGHMDFVFNGLNIWKYTLAVSLTVQQNAYFTPNLTLGHRGE